MRTLTSIDCAILISALATACSAEEDAANIAIGPGESALTVPAPALDRYVVLANHGASFGARTRVAGGAIGVRPGAGAFDNALLGGNDARLAVGQVLLAPRVLLLARAVAGEIGANRVDALLASTGPRSSYVAPPALPVPAQFTAGNTAINVAAGQTRTLAAGSFAGVTVNGTLNLGGGTYQFQNLLLGPGARVVALARASLRIAGSVFSADRARIEALAPLRAGDLRLSVAGATATFGTDSRLSALLIARRLFVAGDRLLASGAIAAEDVWLGNDSSLTYESGFGCSAAAQCDDGNPCTLDACIDAECIHASVADETSCSDGDACTRSDVCRAGSCTGSDRVECEPLDQCHDTGSCDPATGTCSNPAKPDASACDDGDACSHGDRCQSGVCTAGSELAVTEFLTSLASPSSIISGPLGRLWFVAPEIFAGSLSGALSQITPAGVVTPTELLGRYPESMIEGPDGMLWIGQRMLGGLPALSRFDPVTLTSLSDFVGILALDMVATNGSEGPIVWFTGGESVERITPGGTRLAAVPTRNPTRAIAATAGPSPTVWITEANTGSALALIGRIEFPHLLQFPIDTPGELSDIVIGPDAGIWFTDTGLNAIGRLSPNGSDLATYPIPSHAADPRAIAVGPDNNLWFTLRGTNKLGRISADGAITEVCLPTPDSQPTHVTAGPDGNVWFTASRTGKIGRIRLAP